MAAAKYPRRGDLVWIDFNPQSGSEHAGRRPAVVLSPESYNRKVGLALLAPVTGQIKGYPFEVAIPDGLPVSGVVLADQIKSLNWRVRNATRICIIPKRTIDEILGKSRTLLSEE
ncbi:MAG: endoribonuclease MazF [Bacteroidetes bacterium]|nr:endoribonuclease MazF [Bacteroidota bacterium]